jgi:putative addiction module CopG family antidote
MNIRLPQEEQSIVEALVSSGRFASAEDAVAEGIRLLASSERLRQQVQTGIEQANGGDLHDHDTVFGQLKAMAAEAARDG